MQKVACEALKALRALLLLLHLLLLLLLLQARCMNQGQVYDDLLSVKEVKVVFPEVVLSDVLYGWAVGSLSLFQSTYKQGDS